MNPAWGIPHVERVALTVDAEFFDIMHPLRPVQRSEVLFLLPRPGGLLLHTKAHYPPDCFRLLTGTIEPGESVEAAIAREPEEEAGLALPVRRYVAVLHYDIQCEGVEYQWTSHIFLLPYSDAPLRPSHDDEIAATRVVPLDGLAAVADALEALPSTNGWRDWGRFRAIAHRLVLRQVTAGELLSEGCQLHGQQCGSHEA